MGIFLMPKQDKESATYATFDHFRVLAEESGKPALVGDESLLFCLVVRRLNGIIGLVNL